MEWFDQSQLHYISNVNELQIRYLNIANIQLNRKLYVQMTDKMQTMSQEFCKA